MNEGQNYLVCSHQYFQIHTIFLLALAIIVFVKLLEFQWWTNCAPLIAALVLYWHESQFIAKLQKHPSKHSIISYSAIIVDT